MLSKYRIIVKAAGLYHFTDFFEPLSQPFRYMGVKTKGDNFTAQFRVAFYDIPVSVKKQAS